MALTKKEYKELSKLRSECDHINIDMFLNQYNRTILLGYTEKGYIFHSYIHNGELHNIVYNNHTEELLVHCNDLDSIEALTITKRVYPESLDQEFCSICLGKGQIIHFSGYNESRYNLYKDKKYWALTHINF